MLLVIVMALVMLNQILHRLIAETLLLKIKGIMGLT